MIRPGKMIVSPPKFWGWIGRSRDGVALTEFAFVLPILLIFLSFGVELANYVQAIRRVSDLAVLVADNASRMGTRNEGLSVNQITEAEINDVFIGAQLQANLTDFEDEGRIILSSLQRNAQDGQWIAWQRCAGNATFDSAFGSEGRGSNGRAFRGMGPPDNLIQAPPGSAVMVVEIFYNYQPVVPMLSLPPRTIRELAVFNVRENRDLTAPRNPERVEVSDCD